MKLKELFTDSSKWTQGAMARTAQREAVRSTDPNAVCWCFYGGYRKCYYQYIPSEIENLVKEKTKYNSIVDWNDQAAFEQVKALCEELDI